MTAVKFGVGFAPSVAAPQAQGVAILFTATSTGCGSPEYEFWVMPQGGSWSTAQAYGAGATWSLGGSSSAS